MYKQVHSGKSDKGGKNQKSGSPLPIDQKNAYSGLESGQGMAGWKGIIMAWAA